MFTKKCGEGVPFTRFCRHTRIYILTDDKRLFKCLSSLKASVTINRRSQWITGCINRISLRKDSNYTETARRKFLPCKWWRRVVRLDIFSEKDPVVYCKKVKKKTIRETRNLQPLFEKYCFAHWTPAKILKPLKRKFLKRVCGPFFFVCAMVKAKNIKAAKMYTINKLLN